MLRTIPRLRCGLAREPSEVETDFDRTCGLKITKVKLTSYDKDTLRFDSASIGREVRPIDAQGSSLMARLTLELDLSTLDFS